jgi:hypothetical protein
VSGMRLDIDGTREVLADAWERWGHRCAELTRQQWATPTRCRPWDVRALVAHLCPDPAMFDLLDDAEIDGPAAVVDAGLLRRFNQPDGIAHTAADSLAEQAVSDSEALTPDAAVAWFTESARILRATPISKEKVISYPFVGSTTLAVVAEVAPRSWASPAPGTIPANASAWPRKRKPKGHSRSRSRRSAPAHNRKPHRRVGRKPPPAVGSGGCGHRADCLALLHSVSRQRCRTGALIRSSGELTPTRDLGDIRNPGVGSAPACRVVVAEAVSGCLSRLTLSGVIPQTLCMFLRRPTDRP